MIKNTNIQPLRILYNADFLDAKTGAFLGAGIKVKRAEQSYSKSAVQLFIKHRNAERGTIAKALRGIRSSVPRYVVQDFLDLSRRNKMGDQFRVRYVLKSGAQRSAPIDMNLRGWTRKAQRLFFRALRSPFISRVYFEHKKEYMNLWRDDSDIFLSA